jgi:hypothetical protein
MRSDFYALPHAAQRALRQADLDRRRAARASRSAHDKDAELTRLTAEIARLERVVVEAREGVREAMELLGDIDAGLPAWRKLRAIWPVLATNPKEEKRS